MSYLPDSNRQVTLQVCGGNYRQQQRRSNYALTVPYSRLSQTIQRIHRSGGHIIGITIRGGTLADTLPATPTLGETTSVATATPLEKSLEPAAMVAAAPVTFLEPATALPAILPLSRARQKQRRSQLPGTIRRKNRQKRRTKAKVYLLG